MSAELIREEVRIPAANGTLAGELVYPFGRTRYAALIVNAHPHMGGRRGNSLLVRLAEVLAGEGGVVLSFDYSGVGKSDGSRIDVAASMSQFWQTGSAPEDPHMVDDTRRAVAWISEMAKMPLVLIGYSFGAYAAAVALTDDVGGLVLISPTVTRHDFSLLQRKAIPKLIVHSDNDFATPVGDLLTWVAELPQPIDVRCVPCGDHFFRGHEAAVASACLAFVRTVVGVAAA